MKNQKGIAVALDHRGPDKISKDFALGIPQLASGLEPVELGYGPLMVIVGPRASFYSSDADRYTDEWGIEWHQVLDGLGTHDFVEIGLDIFIQCGRDLWIRGTLSGIWVTMDNQGNRPARLARGGESAAEGCGPGGGLILGPAHNVQPSPRWRTYR